MSSLLPCELQRSNSKAAGLTVSAFIGRVLSLAPKQGFERQGAHVLLNRLIDIHAVRPGKKIRKKSSLKRPHPPSTDLGHRVCRQKWHAVTPMDLRQ